MKNKLWELFKTTFTLSTFTFGGGFVIVSLYQKKFVEELKWLEADEMLDIVAISQSVPGPIPVSAAVILGYRMEGIIGALVATLGTVLPPLIIMSLISTFYVQFKSIQIISQAMLLMRAGVAAVIFDVVYGLAKSIFDKKDMLYIVLMLVAFVAVVFLKTSAMTLVLIYLAFGIMSAVYAMKRGKVA